MYYPINKIKPGLYTAGNEFLKKDTFEPYKGYYFSTYDGKYFTGKESTSVSLELIKINDQSANLNNTARTYNKSFVGVVKESTTPNFYLPIPTQEDYQKGFIDRYFIKRVNSGIDTIKEVSKEDYDTFSNNILYTTIQLQWRITGPLYDDNTTIIVQHGVMDSNRRTVIEMNKSMPGISLYLSNLIQFYKIN